VRVTARLVAGAVAHHKSTTPTPERGRKEHHDDHRPDAWAPHPRPELRELEDGTKLAALRIAASDSRGRVVLLG